MNALKHVLVIALVTGAAVYAGGDGIGAGATRSADGGAPAASLERDGAWSVPTGPPGFHADIVLNPSKPGALYLNAGGRVFRTTDAGRSWTAGPPIARRVDALTVDPRNGSVLYAGTSEGVLKSTDGGRTWRRSGLAPTPSSRGREGGEGWVWSIAVDPADSTHVYAVRNPYAPGRNVFRSRDGGATWQAMRLSTWRYVTEIHAGGSGILYVESSFGILRSTDGGTTWRGVLDGSWSLAVDPNRAGTVWAVGECLRGTACSFGVRVTRDGGTTWRSAGRAPADGLSAIVPDPRHARTLYLSTQQSGVFRSIDDGRTWHPFGARPKGLPGRGTGLTELLAIDPRKPGTLYAGDGFGVVATADGGATWRRADAPVVASQVSTIALAASNPATIYTGGVVGSIPGPVVETLSRSDDGGRTWVGLQSFANAGFGQPGGGPLAVDPRDDRHVLIGGLGIFGSRDGGATWTSLLRLPNDFVWKIAFAAGDPRQVYAIVYTTAEERTHLIRSSDGGETWTMQGSAGIENMTAFAVHPERAETVYAGYEDHTGGEVRGGVATSSDGGRSWRYRPISDTPQAIAVAPSDPDTIYAATSVGLERSLDGGDSWQFLPWPEGDLQTVVVDPERSETVYVGTWERGVLRSTDGGATWQPFGARLPRQDVQALAFDPSGTWLYAGMGDAGLTSIRVR